MAGRVGRHLRLAALWAVPLLFLGYFFLYPVSAIITRSLEGFAFAEVFGRERFLRSAWFTIWQALLSTVLTLLVALPLTWVVSRFQFRGRSLVGAAVTVPFVLPTVVVGASFLNLMPRGVLAILAAHVFYNVAVVVRTVGPVWSRIGRQVEEAAATLGASPGQVMRTVTLPLLRPALTASAAIVFLFCFTSFGTVLILGGGTLRTIEVEIYQQAVNFLNLEVAAVLSILQILFVVVALVVAERMQRRVGLALTGEPLRARLPNGAKSDSDGDPPFAFSTTGVATCRLDPTGGWAGLAGQSQVAVNPAEAIGNSLLYAGLATLIATSVGLLAARVITSRGGSWLDTLLMLPLGVSAVTIGLGFLIALDRPIDLRGSFVLVPLAHALVALPFVVRAAVPLLRSIRPELREAAQVLGASPARVWREIDLPIIRRALLVGAGFAAAVSLGEFGATSFVARPASTTIPTLIFRLLGRPGTSSYGTALALAVVLALITAGLILLIERLRPSEASWF